MASSINKKQDQKLRKIASSILKRENEWLEVKGYKLGDIQTELTVYVTKEAAIVGNVLAPRVVVAGIIYGFVASREVIVESTGQIWGDVHSVALEISPGGKLHGWMSTLDEGTVDLLRSGELSTVDLDEIGQRTIPQEILDILPGDVVPLDGQEAEQRLLIWRQLRAEAAMALLARSEIEATFERRLLELANSTLNRDEQIANLRMTLVEREIELKKARESAIQLTKQLKQTRRLATNRIRKLETELGKRK